MCRTAPLHCALVWTGLRGGHASAKHNAVRSTTTTGQPPSEVAQHVGWMMMMQHGVHAVKLNDAPWRMRLITRVGGQFGGWDGCTKHQTMRM